MPDSPSEFWVGFAVFALLCVGACRVSRRFYWSAVPCALFVLYRGWSFLYSNESFSGVLLSEFGLSYWLQFAGAYALPVLSLLAYAIYDFRYKSRVSSNVREGHPGT